MNSILKQQLADWRAKQPPAGWREYFEQSHEPGKLDPREFGSAIKWRAPEKLKPVQQAQRDGVLQTAALRDLSKVERRRTFGRAA